MYVHVVVPETVGSGVAASLYGRFECTSHVCKCVWLMPLVTYMAIYMMTCVIPHEAIYGTCAYMKCLRLLPCVCADVCLCMLVFARLPSLSLLSLLPLSHSPPPHRYLDDNEIRALPESFGSLQVGGDL